MSRASFVQLDAAGWERIHHLAGLSALPIVVAFLYPNWFVSQFGWDAWFYTGFFLNYPDYISTQYPATYYGSRLAWILPGFVAHSLLPPVAAAYVLHVGVWYLAVFSLYATASRLFGARAGLLAALLMGAYDHFLMAVGWDYVDGAGLAYCLLTTYLLTRGAQAEDCRSWAFLAGVSSAAAIHTNLMLILWIAPLAVYFAIVRGPRPSRRLLKDLGLCALFAAAGGVVLTLLLGGINLAAGGVFLFFMPSIHFARWYDALPNEHKDLRPLLKWITVSWWMVIPAAALCAALVQSALEALRHAEEANSRNVLAVSSYLLIALVVVLTLRGDVAAFFYYGSYFIGPSFLAVSMLFRDAQTLSLKTFVTLVGTVTALLLLDLGFQQRILLVKPLLNAGVLPPKLPLESVQAAVALTLMLGAVALSSAGFRRIKSSVCVVTGVVLAFVVLPPFNKAINSPDYARVVEGMRVVRSLSVSGRPRFWFDAKDRLQVYYYSVASISSPGYRIINETFPSPDRPRGPIEKGDELAILTTDQDSFPKAAAAVATAGHSLRLVGQRRIDVGGDAYYVVCALVK